MAFWGQEQRAYNGDLADMDYYCDRDCAVDAGAPVSAFETLTGYDNALGYALGSSVETNFTEFCTHCDRPLWVGVEDRATVEYQLHNRILRRSRRY